MSIEDRLLIIRAALKGLLQDLESERGVTEAYGTTEPILESICGINRALSAERKKV